MLVTRWRDIASGDAASAAWLVGGLDVFGLRVRQAVTTNQGKAITRPTRHGRRARFTAQTPYGGWQGTTDHTLTILPEFPSRV
jgi:hypothetical protein